MVCQPCPWFARIVLSSWFVSCSVWFLTRIIIGWAFTFLLALWQIQYFGCWFMYDIDLHPLQEADDGTPWDGIVAGHCHGYVAVEGVWMCISTATVHIACWIFFSFSHLQNCNYSQITLFSFTFFWFSLLFGKEFLSSGFLSLFSLFHVWVFLFPSDGTATQSSKVLWCILTVLFLGLLSASLLTCSLSGIVEPKCLRWWKKPNMNVRDGVRGTETTDQKHSFCTKWGYVRLERIRERQQSELKPPWVAEAK